MALGQQHQKVGHRLPLPQGAGLGHERLHKGIAPRQAAQHALQMLASRTRARRLAIQRVVRVQVIQQRAAHFQRERRGQLAARGQVVRHLPQQPGRAPGGAPQHHRVGPRGSEHGGGLFGRINVAIGHHRHAHGGLDGGNGFVLCLARVALLARAAMHRDHLHARALGGARQRNGVALRRAPARAHLQRDRHALRRASGHHGLDDAQRQRLVLHQCAARPLAAHLARRAAHVDVNHLRAARHVPGRALGHGRRISPHDLHRKGARLAFMAAAQAALGRAAQIRPRRHHLRHRVARPEAAAKLAERPVGHPRHRRHEHGIGQRVRPNAHGRRQWRKV